MEVVETVERRDGMLERLTRAAGPQAVTTRLRRLRQLIIRTEQLLIVTVCGVAGGVVDTGIFRCRCRRRSRVIVDFAVR